LVRWLEAVVGFYRDDPFDFETDDPDALLQAALDVISYSGSDMARKTKRQLLGCELNMVSGTFALYDSAAHEALCMAAEDALNTPGANLAGIHDLLDRINNIGGGSQSPSLASGSLAFYTITVTAAVAEETDVIVKDCLDGSFEFVYASDGGVCTANGHSVSWSLKLPAGVSVTSMTLWVKVKGEPKNDNAGCGDGLVCSDWAELPFGSSGAILRNRACLTGPDSEPPADSCGPCSGKVVSLVLLYEGSEDDAWVKVVQKQDGAVVFEGVVDSGELISFTGIDKQGTLGTDIRIHLNGALHTTIHTSCSQPIGPGLTRGFFTVISGMSKKGGPLCPLEAPPHPSCGECRGKVTSLTLRFDGDAPATITVVQKKNGAVVFDDSVDPDGEFSFSGADKDGTLGTDILIYVDGTLNTTIHTSCSQPIGPGLVKGDFEVISGTSKDGGLLCPLP